MGSVANSMRGIGRFLEALRTRSMATSIGVGMIPTGICGLALGQGSSRAFTLLPGGAFMAYLYGAFLVLGGLGVAWGIGRGDAYFEALGSAFIFAGAAIYGGGVYLGLGLNGLIAGTLGMLIALGSLGRIGYLLTAAPPERR